MRTIKLSEVKQGNKIMFFEGAGFNESKVYVAKNDAKLTSTLRVRPISFKEENGVYFSYSTGLGAVVDYEVTIID